MVPPSFFVNPTKADLANFTAFRAYMATQAGVPFPGAELRQQQQAKADGSVGPDRTQPYVVPAINAGEQKYSAIHVPILAFYAIPRSYSTAFSRLDPEIQTKILNYDLEHKAQDIKALEKCQSVGACCSPAACQSHALLLELGGCVARDQCVHQQFAAIV
jgi:hypothetical protein